MVYLSVSESSMRANVTQARVFNGTDEEVSRSNFTNFHPPRRTATNNRVLGNTKGDRHFWMVSGFIWPDPSQQKLTHCRRQSSSSVRLLPVRFRVVNAYFNSSG